MGSAMDDVEFLAGSAYRVAALRELLEGPRRRYELREATGASKATISRLLNELEDRRWTERDGHSYALTDPGEVVASAFIALVDTVETERTLREVWDYLPTDLPGFTVSLFEDAVVRLIEPGAPYQPIPRTMELIESTGSFSMFSERVPKPATLEGITRNAAAGTATELVLLPAVVGQVVETASSDVVRRAVERGWLTVLERESFPTDTTVVIYDDRVGLYCRDRLGVTRLSIDTDAPDAVRWGTGLYEDVRAGARSVDLRGRVA